MHPTAPARPDLSHRFCYASNLSSRSSGHGAHTRLRIKFDAESFQTWRNIWGDNVFFTILEYRKLRVSVEHGFILLRGLSGKKGFNHLKNTPHDAAPTPSSGPRTGQPRWWTTVPSDVHNFVLKFEREANPDSQINAIVKTEAFDYVDFREFFELEGEERNSTTELTISFPQQVAVEEVVKICASISQHQAARLYTLRQFNCFFYSWTIITILLQRHVDWESALHSNTNRTLELLTTKLVELSNPQRARAQPRQYRSRSSPEVWPNLALLIAGEYECTGVADASQRPFVRLCHKKIKESSVLKKMLASIQDPSRQVSVWARDDLRIVRDHIRDLLNEIADSTTGLATEGTGELTIDALFWGDLHVQNLSAGWDNSISKEVKTLLEIYVDRMWGAFKEALKQTSESNKARRFEQSTTHNPSALQSIGNSPLVLGSRLIPLGLRTAWNATRMRASLGPTESPLMPLIKFIKTIRDVPNQIRNVSAIARNFLAVLAMKREETRNEIYQTRDEDQNQGRRNSNLSLNLGRTTVFGMMRGIDLQRPEFEGEIIHEFEKAVKNLALSHPTCSMDELRLATIELLIRLKETGKGINFAPRPENLWQICLWYSLGDEIAQVIEAAAEPGPTKRIECWIRTSKDEARGEGRPMLVSDIHRFIHSRITDLSEMIHNQGGPGATVHCRKEIEEAMNTIWKEMLKDNKKTVIHIDERARVSTRTNEEPTPASSD